MDDWVHRWNGRVACREGQRKALQRWHAVVLFAKKSDSVWPSNETFQTSSNVTLYCGTLYKVREEAIG